MKKIVKYLVAAIAMVAAVSCQKELVEEKAPVKDGDSYVFTASLKPATKTVLNIDEETGVMKSQWWAGAKGKEYINVMDDREVNNKYASANLQEAADKTDFSLDEGADFYGTEVFAVYPYHANNAYWKGEEGEIGVVADFKQIQTATSGNYDPTAPVHVAYNPDITASTNLVFSNLSALVKFDVTTDFVRTITLSGLNGEMVSGPMVYKYANGKYTLEDNTDGYVEVTLTAAPYDYANGNGNAEQNYFAKGAHYLAIVPGTFEKGIQITLNAGLENPITFTHNDPITLRPGTVNDFGAFGTDKNLDWGVAKVGEEEKAQKLEYKDGYFVGTVALTKDESYKIVASQEDYDASNYGLSFPREYAPVGKYDLATGEAGYEIRVDKTGEYDVMFSTGMSVLYLLDKGAAADEDFDLSEVKTPDPVRTITGGFVDMDEVNDGKTEMTLVTDKDGNALYYETVIEFAENATDFTIQILDGIKDQTTPGQYVKFGWEKPENYEYDGEVTFATEVNGAAIDAVSEPGYYYIKQSVDGSTITVVTPKTPDGAQWIFEWEDIDAPALFDFGVTFEDLFIFAGDPDSEDVYYDQFRNNTPKYKFIPTGLTSGNFCYYDASLAEAPAELDVLFTYTKFDGNSFEFSSEVLYIDAATATKADEYCEIYIETPAGYQWAFNMYDGQLPAVLDLGCTFENLSYYAVDADTYTYGAAPVYVSGKYLAQCPMRAFTIVPTSYTTGEIYLSSDTMQTSTSSDAASSAWLTYSGFNGSSFVIESCTELIGMGMIAAKTPTSLVSPRNPYELYIDSPEGKQLLPISYEKKADGSIVKTGYEGVVYDMGYSAPGKIVVAYFEPDECTEAEKEYSTGTITDLVPPTDAIYRVSDYEDPSDPGYDYLLEYDDMYSGSFMFIGKNGKTGEFDEMQILYSDFSKNGYFVYVAFDSETEPMICEVRGYNSSDSFNTPLTLSPDGEAVSEFNIEGEQLWARNGDVQYVIDLGESFIVAKSADGETWEKVLVADNYEIVASPNPELVAYFVDITSDGVDYSFSFEPGETPMMVNVFEETLIYSEVKSIDEETEEEIIEYLPLAFLYNSDPELRIEL